MQIGFELVNPSSLKSVSKVFDETLQAIDEANFIVTGFFALNPFPGTKVFEHLSEEGRILHHDWTKYNMEDVVYQPKSMTVQELRNGLNYVKTQSNDPKRLIKNLEKFNKVSGRKYKLKLSEKIALWSACMLDGKKYEYHISMKSGGPDGELAASLRYLSQRFSMPTEEAKSILNDIGTEELAHLEMVGTMVHQLTKGVPADVLEKEGLGAYYSDHDHAVYPVSASGTPFTAAYIQSKGDPIADLVEDLAAEQKARATYENLINLADDPDVIDPLRFLREREVVHFQRFGEALRIVQDKLGEKKFYISKAK